jgi:branched-chain amino acid transport system permease protein
MEWVNAAIQGVLLGGLYALLATGLSLVFGVMRVVNLAHGDLGILAAFLMVVVVDATGVNPLLGLVVVVPLMVILGYALQRGLLETAVQRGLLGPLLVTFGLAVVLQNSLLTVFTADSQGLDAGPIETASLRLTDRIAVGWLPLLTFAVAVGVLVGLQLLMDRTQLGRALRAVSDDGEAARVVGIDDRHVFAVAMAIALGTVAIGGVFLGIRTTFSPFDGPVTLLFAFEAVVIGGLGSIWGTLLGGIVLGVSQAIGAQISPAYQVLAGHLVFLAVLLVRPTGLLARPTTRQA